MNILKPKALKPGDVVGIAAPASPPASDDQFAKGIRYLELHGYRVELGKHCYSRKGYLAGSDRDRVADLHELFGKKEVKAIFTVRGGYGCTRILSMLDYRLIRRNPKILVGYSDITALQLALLSKAGLVSFSGPMVAVEMAGSLTGNSEELFWRALTSSKKLPPLRIAPGDEHRIVIAGKGEGILYGGNLSLVASLVGTEYVPRCKQSLLLVEEIGERPYRINRMLNQLKLAGMFKRISGIALGLFTDCEPEPGKPSLTLQEVFDDAFHGFTFPVGGHFHYGHTADLATIPFGIGARIDSKRGSLVFLENGVE